MGKMLRKGADSEGIICTPLQDHMPVNFKVLGTPAWLKGAWEPGALSKDQIIVVKGSNPLDEAKEYLSMLDVIGADTETTGPYVAGDKRYSMTPWNEGTRMVLLQMGGEDMSYLIEPDLANEFQDILEADWVLKILHNASYDFKWLLVKYGIHLVRLYDSMLSEQLLTAGIPAMKVGLADSSRRRAPYWLINKAVRDQFINLGDRKMTGAMAYYAARDVPLLFPLYHEQIAEFKKWKMLTCASDEFDVLPAVCEMEMGGVCLAQNTLKQIIGYWNKREAEVGADILKIYDTEIKKKGKVSEVLFPEMAAVFNLKSNAAKLEALRDLDLDLDNIKRDSLKEASKNEKLPEAVRKITKLMAEYSNIVKMTSTYGQNMLDKINLFTGMWHPEFNQCGSGDNEFKRGGGESSDSTATGRMSSDAQQFPKPQARFDTVTDPSEIEFVSTALAEAIAAVRVQVKELVAV